MRKGLGFYSRLAWTNMRKNKETYLPYFCSCIGCIAMLYMILFLLYNKGLDYTPSPGNVRLIMKMGTGVIIIFSFIFLLYSNSFLMKRRQKEIGLYNILGMEKGHIGKILFIETVVTGVVSLIGGISLGILGSKLSQLLLLKILRVPAQFGFSVSGKAIGVSSCVYGIIFLLTLGSNLRRVRLSCPAELLRGNNTGEREPKAKWLMALLGFLCLGGGYTLAVTTKSPLEALPLFFVAVLLVMAGTYLVFTAGSIVILKILRWKKSFYYKVQNFTSVSGMLYRMKQNAVGLASICILSTGVLLMLSTTVSLYMGIEDVMQTRYPYDASVSFRSVTLKEGRKIQEYIQKSVEREQLPYEKLVCETSLNTSCILKDHEISFAQPEDISEITFDLLLLIPEKQVKSKFPNEETLEEGEVLLWTEKEKNWDHLLVGEKEYRVKECLKEWPMDTEPKAFSYMNLIGLVVTDEDFEQIRRVQAEAYGKNQGYVAAEIGMDVKGESDEEILRVSHRFMELAEEAEQEEKKTQDSWVIKEIREENYDMFYSMDGGLLFLGIFLGGLFLLGTAMLIYYKQMSEGYEDRERFSIMRKVGMSKKEVKASIRKQILMIFFLPLLMAILHIVMAFPLVKRLLLLMNMTNTTLFIVCTAATILIFALVYAVIYLLTARSYYKILYQSE